MPTATLILPDCSSSSIARTLPENERTSDPERRNPGTLEPLRHRGRALGCAEQAQVDEGKPFSPALVRAGPDLIDDDAQHEYEVEAEGPEEDGFGAGEFA